ncbi:MAG: hypothetical protein ABIU54_10690 [Candidatus Eisenbacteria bacterium]
MPRRKAVEIASAARAFEETGAYGLAAAALRELRGRVTPDADLELALALDEARSGQGDSAWARIDTPLMRSALADTSVVARRAEYPFQREPLWMNGRFDGWYWYVARTRAELSLARGEWRPALEAALVAVSARPLSGTEFLLLGVCAGRAGETELAEAAATAASVLEPALPEAQYLRGLLAWRAGQRTEAQRRFRIAADLDSSYRAPALALPRALLPGIKPDSLPTVFLTGARACLVLTSPVRPKLEEFVQMDEAPGILSRPMPPLPEALKRRLALTKPMQLYVHVLVSEAGLPLLTDLPYLPRDAMPAAVVAHIASALHQWRFRAPVRLGQPKRGWATVEYTLQP